MRFYCGSDCERAPHAKERQETMKEDALKQAAPRVEGRVISVKNTFAQLSSTQTTDDLTSSRSGVVEVTQMVRVVSLKEALYSPINPQCRIADLDVSFLNNHCGSLLAQQTNKMPMGPMLSLSSSRTVISVHSRGLAPGLHESPLEVVYIDEGSSYEEPDHSAQRASPSSERSPLRAMPPPWDDYWDSCVDLHAMKYRRF